MIEAFLSTLWRPVGFGEIRVIDPRSHRVSQRFFDLSEGGLSVVVPHVEAVAEEGGRDIYFGVLPRMRRSGTAADALPSTDVLWADIDGKVHPGAKDGAYKALWGYPIRPSIIVDSGNGYHGYWLLRDLVAFEEASLAMKSIAKAVGGDHTYDAARVLRVPGTTNYKNPDDLLPVRVIAFTQRRYRWSDFDAEVVREKRHVRLSYLSTPPGDYGDLPEWLRDLIERGAPHGSRSEMAFKACVWLARFGWSDADIFAAFQNHPDGIGAKYAERKDGDRWLSVTLAAARARA